MSRNMTAIRLEIQKVTRIRISARNKSDPTILFETRIVININTVTRDITYFKIHCSSGKIRSK